MRMRYTGWIVGGAGILIGGFGVAWGIGHYGPFAHNQSFMGKTHSRALGGYVGSMQSPMTSMGVTISRITGAHLTALVRSSERGGVINRATNSLTYTASPVMIVALAAPTALRRPGLQWEIDGRINPTVIVPSHASVTVAVVNADKGYMHGFEVTTARPPFAWDAMRQGNLAFSGGFVHPLLPESHGTFSLQRTTFRTTNSDTYEYICPVPGHAQHGMAGILRVQ